MSSAQRRQPQMSHCLGCGTALDPSTEQRKYCSATCAVVHATDAARHRTGKAKPNYRGGLCFDSGKNRWVICCRDGSLMLYYRGVMAAELGRLLRSDEIVHHVNGDTTDDRVGNLQIVTRSEHINMHRADLLRAKGLAA